MPDIGSSCFSSLFWTLFTSQLFSFVGFWVGQTAVILSFSVQSMEKLVTHLILPFIAGEFPLGDEQSWLENVMIQAKWSYSSFPFCAVIFYFYFFSVAEELQSSSRAFLYMDSCLIVDFCGGMEAGVSYSVALVIPLFPSLRWDKDARGAGFGYFLSSMSKARSWNWVFFFLPIGWALIK